VNIKKLTKKDIEGYKELFVYCFNMKEDDARQYAKTCLECGESIGVEENDRLVSAMAYYPYDANIHSSRLKMAGLTGVVTAPEMRNRGYVKEQLVFIQKIMLENNFPISYLEPFKHSYYEKYGWTEAAKIIRATIRVDDIKKIEEEFQFKKIEEPKSENFSEIERAYSSLFHGCSYRTKCLWENAILFPYHGRKYTYYLIEHKGEKVAYLGLRFVRIKNSYQVNLNISDFGFKNYLGIKGLFNFFKTHRDQCRYVHINLPTNFDLYHFAPTRPKELKLKFDKMFKVVDVAKAMQQIQPAKNLDFDLTINITRDVLCSENTGEFSFRIKDGKVEEIEHSKNLLECDINTFSKLFIGKNSLKKLIDYNEVKLEGDIKESLNQMFQEKPVYVKDWF